MPRFAALSSIDAKTFNSTCARRNRRGQLFLLTFQSGQDALIQRSALFGLSFSLSGRSCVRHIVRFRKSTETTTSFNRVK
jgi:hypothetical protein